MPTGTRSAASRECSKLAPQAKSQPGLCVKPPIVPTLAVPGEAHNLFRVASFASCTADFDWRLQEEKTKANTKADSGMR